MSRVVVATCVALLIIGCGESPPEPASEDRAVNWPDEISERFEQRGHGEDHHVDGNE